MKVLMAGLATETNSFSPIPTGRLAFEDAFVSRAATAEPANLFSAPLHEWRRMAEERGWSVAEGLCAFAQPGGVTIRAAYEAYRDEILADLEKHRLTPDIGHSRGAIPNRGSPADRGATGCNAWRQPPYGAARPG